MASLITRAMASGQERAFTSLFTLRATATNRQRPERDQAVRLTAVLILFRGGVTDPAAVDRADGRPMESQPERSVAG
jgi:hypothetical protein